MAISIEALEARLREHLPGIVELRIIDLTGTQDHYEAHIAAQEFSGKTTLQQHQLVYKALEDWMKGPIHALTLKTTIPKGD